MSVFRKPHSSYWYYEFRIGGRRYNGSTKTRTERDAEAFERAMRERALRGRLSLPKRKQRLQRLRKYPINQPLVGVYLLLLNEEIVYVGASLEMPERVNAHRRNGRPFDRVVYIPTAADEREVLEQILIRAINPPQNRNGRGAA